MRLFALFLAGLLCTSPGCQPAPAPASAPGAARAAPPASRTVLPRSVDPAGEEQRRLSPSLAPLGAATLIGKVKLISDKGLGVISNNTGNVVSNNGGSLIGEDGLGLISDRGGNVVSTNGGNYRALAVEAARESWLAEAVVEVVDAEGRVLTDDQGQPLRTVTDEMGAYTLEATLPHETLLLRVRPHAGGTLLAILPREVASGGRWRVPVDTASSLGAAYVLDRYVQSRQAVLDRLPGVEAVALYRDMAAAARRGLTETPDYTLERQVEVAERLRGAAAELAGTLSRIEALLLAGQSRLGNGLLATEVALSAPTAALEDGFGGLLIAEGVGRIRRVDAEGRVSLFLGDGAGDPAGLGRDLTGIGDMAGDGRGGWIVSEPFAQRVRRLAPDGTMTVIAGSGRRGAGQTGIEATAASLDFPTALAVGPDGSIYIGEQPRAVSETGRILRLDGAGLLHEVPAPEPEWKAGRIAGLAAGDGVLWAVEGQKGLLARKEGQGPWTFVARGLKTNADSRLWLDADGTLYMSETAAHRVLAFAPDGGTRRVVAGTGAEGAAGDGGPAVEAALSLPAGLWRSAAGRLVVVDGGNARVRVVAPDGTIRTVAGALAKEQAGGAVGLALNTPRGLAVDARNRVLVAEGSGGTIKRLENGVLSVFAGTVSGFGGDGGPAIAASLDGPYGLAFSGETLYVVDTENKRIRRIDPDGTIATVVGTGARGGLGGLRGPALETGLVFPMGLTIGPDGLPTFADAGGMVVLRLTAEGELVHVAGDPNGVKGFAGDGGPAIASKLNNPSAVAYDGRGNLYIAEMGGCRIRKVDGEGVITTIAGIDATQMITRLLAGQTSDADGSPAIEASLFLPTAICFDEAGNLYVAERGTANADALAAEIPADLLAELPVVGSRIRRITPEGRIEAVAGEGTALFSDPLGDNALKTPLALAFDRNGRLLVADTGNNQLKVISKDQL